MKETKKTSRTKVLAYRRTCKMNGNSTGLSHYILMGNKRSRTEK